MKLPSIYEGSFLANLDSPRQSPRLPGPHASSSIFDSESRSPFPSTIHKRSRSNNPAILQALDRKLANITPIQPTIDPNSARGYGPSAAQYYQGYSSPNLSPNIRPVNHHSRRNHSHETIKIVPGQYPMNSYPVPLMRYVPHPMPIKIPVIPTSNLLYGHNSPSSYSNPNHDSHERLIKLVEKQNNLIERMAHKVDSQYEKMFKSEKKSLNKKLEKLKLEKLMDQRIAQNANSMSSLSNLMLFKDKKTVNSSNDFGSGRIPSIARLLDD